jgi:UDP-glucose 4-epimerase
VLGGTGLIGAEVARRALEEGASVTVLARNAPDPGCARLLDGARVVVGDATDRAALCEAMDGAAHVVDALGVPHPAASAEAPGAQDSSELPILDHVLAELRRRPGVGLSFVSSGGAVYGDAAHLPVTESTPCHPCSPYGVTKVAAERRVLLAADDQGLTARVLRVGNAYGARQRHDTGQGLVATMLHAARTAAPVRIFGDGTATRDYVDARDVADAVVRLAVLRRGPRVVNVGTGHGHQVRDVQAEVERLTGARLEVWRAPARPSDVAAVVLDTTRLRVMVGWRPRSLRKGLEEAWRSVCTEVARPELALAGAR